MMCCNMARRYAFQYFSAATIRNVSRGSSVVLNRLRAPRPKYRCSVPCRDKRCFPAKRPHGLWGPPNGVSNGYLGALSWLLKRMGLEAIHLKLVPSSRMRGVILPFPQVAIMAWSLIKQGHNLTFSLRKVSRHCKRCPTDDLNDRWSWREGGNLGDRSSKQGVNRPSREIIFHFFRDSIICVCG